LERATGSDGQLLRDLLKAADGIDWLQDSLAQLEAVSPLWQLRHQLFGANKMKPYRSTVTTASMISDKFSTFFFRFQIGSEGSGQNLSSKTTDCGRA
jgi:hypothetical protein